MQCFKCLRYGHIALNCFQDIACPKCGEAHTKDVCNNNIFKCINCKGSHDSNSRDCPIYQKIANNINNRTTARAHPPTNLYLPDGISNMLNNSSNNINARNNSGSNSNSSNNNNINRNNTYAAITRNGGNNVSESATVNSSELNIFTDLLSLVKDLNLSKIVECIKTTLNKLKNAGDMFSKIIIIAEAIIQFL